MSHYQLSSNYQITQEGNQTLIPVQAEYYLNVKINNILNNTESKRLEEYSRHNSLDIQINSRYS